MTFLSVAPELSALVDRFAAVRHEHPSLETVLRDSLERLGWARSQLQAWEALPDHEVSQAGAQAVLYRTGLAVAARVNADTQAAYHNRDHTAEAVLSAEALLAAEPMSDLLRKNQGLRLLVAMTAHDVGHTGAFGGPKGALEQASAATFLEVWNHFDPQPTSRFRLADRLAVEAIVLGTEFVDGPRQNYAAYQRQPENLVHRLQVLANDADILASVLPQTGPERGRLLAQEWHDAGPHAAAAAATVGTWAGRLGFLRSVGLRSRAADALGIPDLQATEVVSLQALSPAALGMLSVEQARTAVLEYMAEQQPTAQLAPAARRFAP